MIKKVIIGLVILGLLIATNHRTKIVYMPVEKCGAKIAYGSGHLVRRVTRAHCHKFSC